MKSTAMRKLHLFSAVLSLFLLVPASIIWAQTVSSQKGLTTAIFSTNHGKIKIYLPDDIRPGDVISGTIAAEPSGNNERQRTRNLAELIEHSVIIDGNKYLPAEKPVNFQWLVHLDRNVSVPIELLQVTGKKTGELKFPIQPVRKNISPLPQCLIPSHALTGDPIQITGPFDGNASNTKCLLGNKPLDILTESPRAMCTPVSIDVADPGGSRAIQVMENGKPLCSRDISLVKMEVTTGTLNLLKGQSTNIDVKITGLANIPSTAVLTVNNLSGDAVNMLPAENMVIPITPEMAAAGSFSYRFDIHAIRGGSFQVNIDLDLGDKEPPVFFDVPKGGTGNENKNDTVPCREETLAEKQKELESLKAELAGIDAAIGEAKKDTAACNIAKKKKAAQAASANEAFKSQEQRKKNWDKSGKEAPASVDKDYNKAKEEKEKADAEAAAQRKDCAAKDKKVKDLTNRKDVLPGLIKNQESLADVLKTEVEKCKKEAEDKKKKEEEEKKKAADDAAAKTAAEAAEKAARSESISHQRYLLQNIYSLGLISSREFWETKGLWDWLPEQLSKPIGDLAEDKGNPSPIPIDIIPALAGIYQVVGKMLDPCSPDGARKTVERLKKQVNTKTNAKYTDEEALTKTEQMCEVLQKLKAMSQKAGGK